MPFPVTLLAKAGSTAMLKKFLLPAILKSILVISTIALGPKEGLLFKAVKPVVLKTLAKIFLKPNLKDLIKKGPLGIVIAVALVGVLSMGGLVTAALAACFVGSLFFRGFKNWA